MTILSILLYQPTAYKERRQLAHQRQINTKPKRQKTFTAFSACGTRPFSAETEGIERVLSDNINDAWSLMQDPDTYVFLAGLEKLPRHSTG